MIREMDFIGFVGNLKTHEMELKARKERELPKKTNVSFKASQSKSKKEEDSDEELSMLVKKMNKCSTIKEGRQEKGNEGHNMGFR